MAITFVAELFAFLHSPLALSPVIIFVTAILVFTSKVYKDCKLLVKQLEQESQLFE